MKRIFLLIFLILQVKSENFTENFSRFTRAISCGTAVKSQGFIVDGVQVAKGDYPWMAALIYRKTASYFCGGTIISPLKILTAAHCIQDKRSTVRKLERDILIMVGMFDLSNHGETGRTSLDCQEIFIHPRWNPFVKRFDADLAILEPDVSIAFNRHIVPICLWSFNEKISLRIGTVVGYGQSEDKSKDFENIPSIIDVPIYNNEHCIQKDSQFATITSSNTLCAGSGNSRGVCKGDSGSGLIFKHRNKFFLLGIVSASFVDIDMNCDVTRFAVYTNVLKYKDWIENPSNEYQITAITEPPVFEVTKAPDAYVTQPPPTINNYKFKENEDLNSVCGVVKIATGVVVNGKRAVRGQFPWLVAIYKNDHDESVFICGGVLISKRLVLTVAGCIHPKRSESILKAENVFIYLGKYYLERNDDEVIISGVSHLIIHQHYNAMSESYDANIAVAILHRTINFNNLIKPICIWTLTPNYHDIINQKGVVAGWGRKDKSLSPSEIPFWAKLVVVDEVTCLRSNSIFSKLTSNRTFCAGNRDGIGPCNGDQGGGFFVKSQGKWYLRGLISFSLFDPELFMCDTRNYAGYTDVAQFYNWIEFYLKSYE